MFQDTQKHEDVETRYLPVREGEQTSAIRVRIHPAQDKHAATGATLLVFEERDEPADAPAIGASSPENMVALHLERELMQTKQQLHAAIEQYETTLEDLKGANEELQASNEELRSTAEELETSKEELQSINEELVTVNNELKMKCCPTGRQKTGSKAWCCHSSTFPGARWLRKSCVIANNRCG